MEQKSSLKNQPIFKPALVWAIVLTVGAVLTTSTVFLYSLSRSQTTRSSPLLTSASPIKAVSALGRLEPLGEVIKLSPPSPVQGQGVRIAQLLVKEGDLVRSGQVVAILCDREQNQAALTEAKRQVQVDRANLAKVKAGAKAGDIMAQKATIARLEEQLLLDQREERRYQYLFQTGAISVSLQDSKHLAVKTDWEQLNQAKSSLASIVEVRPTDVRVAQAQVEQSLAAVEQAQAKLNLSYIRSPISGQVLKIHTWPGESVGDKGIADLGQTAVMVAVAEVNENNIGQVRLGQRATITSNYRAFAGKLQGTVIKIGQEIGKQDVLNTDPAADTDARVVEVKIRLDSEDSQQVADLTYAKVVVKIES